MKKTKTFKKECSARKFSIRVKGTVKKVELESGKVEFVVEYDTKNNMCEICGNHEIEIYSKNICKICYDRKRYIDKIGVSSKKSNHYERYNNIMKSLNEGKMKQSEIARKNGVSRQYVSKIKKNIIG